jgi:hypothetical protein
MMAEVAPKLNLVCKGREGDDFIARSIIAVFGSLTRAGLWS